MKKSLCENCIYLKKDNVLVSEKETVKILWCAFKNIKMNNLEPFICLSFKKKTAQDKYELINLES